MGCSPFDVRDYFFGELSNADRHAVEKHVAGCTSCREELDALQLTQAALLSVRDEEPPRRIAFVSDKVFEPRWYERIWNSGPKLGFASAGLLSAAIVAHGFIASPRAMIVQQVQPPVAAQVRPASLDSAAVRAEVERQLKPIVEQVVLESEKRTAARFAAISADQNRSREDLNNLAETVGYMRRTVGNIARANMESGVAQ